VSTVTVDAAGGRMGGAARLKAELDRYIDRSGRDDVRIIGTSHKVDPAWLLRRETTMRRPGRRVALNNVSFVAPGGERWTLLRNALHFMTEAELSRLDSSTRATAQREGGVVRLAARRSDVLVAPCTAMVERVLQIMPSLGRRVVVRLHPVSADSIPNLVRDPAILCPILLSPYKKMTERLSELLQAIDGCDDASIQLRVTADRAELPPELESHPRIELVGRLSHASLRKVWGRSRAIYFPTGIESFGYPLAEARASGRAVIARDTEQNREIAGHALCGFTLGDDGSLLQAVKRALTTDVAPDPAPFDPDAYFGWLLGPPR
jgi:Glycosyl transferases group 1